MESRNTRVKSFCGKSQYECGKCPCGNRNTSVESGLVETAMCASVLWFGGGVAHPPLKPQYARAHCGLRAFQKRVNHKLEVPILGCRTFQKRVNHTVRVHSVVWRGVAHPPLKPQYELAWMGPSVFF